jgi:hypothetical protein
MTIVSQIGLLADSPAVLDAWTRTSIMLER